MGSKGVQMASKVFGRLFFLCELGGFEWHGRFFFDFWPGGGGRREELCEEWHTSLVWARGATWSGILLVLLVKIGVIDKNGRRRT